MTRPFDPFSHRTASMLVALLVATLGACGGGAGVIGSGGTGSPLGMAVGTVNGFGSVIVDGQAFDDRTAAVVTEVSPGVDEITEVKLGDRVSVEYSTPGVASVVRVETALAGNIDSVPAADRLSMLGQTVSIVSNGAQGPVTQFGGGYTQPADLRAGDAVEIHGLLLHDGSAVQIQATRIDKLAAAPAYLRVSGIVGALQTGTAIRFTLGALTVDATSATVVPSGAALANGQGVTVLAPSASLTAPPAGAWRLQAAQVRIAEVRDEGLEDALSGSVAHLDSASRTFVLGSLRVSYAAATLSPSGWTPAEGQYVLVRGNASPDGSLIATSVSKRDTGSETEAELRGNILGYDATTQRFNVRGVPVDASSPMLEVQGCPASGLANGLYVEIEGATSSDGVVASKLQCDAEPSGASVEREGVAGTVDSAARTFSLKTEGGAMVPVRWTDTTYFGGVAPATLSGQEVHVEGSFVDGVLVANKVER